MKPVLFPVAPAKKTAEFIRPLPQPLVTSSVAQPVFEDLASSVIAPASQFQLRRGY